MNTTGGLLTLRYVLRDGLAGATHNFKLLILSTPSTRLTKLFLILLLIFLDVVKFIFKLFGLNFFLNFADF